MELLQLKYFQELARTEHLSKTAEKLHIAQPSLSQTLKRLETELGTPLFDRVGKRIVLNTSGKIFLKYVNEIFTALDNAALELKTVQQTESKSISLHIYSASMLLPALVKQIQRADADIRLQISQLSIQQETNVPSLFVTSSHTCPKAAHVIPLMKEPLVAALPKNHALVRKPALTLDDLRQESFLSLKPASNLSTTLQYYCEKYHFTPHITTYADNPAMMRDLLRLDLGIAFVPERTWNGFASDTMILKPVADMPMERYIMLSWDPDRYQTPTMQLCKEVIIQYFTEYNSQFQSQSAK